MFYRSYKEIDNQSSNKEKHRIKCQIKKKSSDAPYDLKGAKINNLFMGGPVSAVRSNAVL